MLGGVRPELVHLAISGVSGLVIFALGLVYFKRMERVFADIV